MKTKNLNGNFNVVGLNIKKYRELNNLSQRELSDKLSLYGINLYPVSYTHLTLPTILRV